MAPWTPRVKIPSAQAIGTTLHCILEQVVADATRGNVVLRAQVEALITREQQLRVQLEDAKRARDFAQRSGVSTAEYWMGRFEEMRDSYDNLFKQFQTTSMLRYSETIRANNAERERENYKRDVLARAYGGIPWVKDLGKQKETQ